MLNYCDMDETTVSYCNMCNVGVCQPGTIQLVATQSEGTGLVQVCLDGSWTYVCGNGWSNVDAGIACRQLGYSFYCKFHMKYIHVTANYVVVTCYTIKCGTKIDICH